MSGRRWALVLAGLVMATGAAGSTGWVERIELVPPALTRTETEDGLLIRTGDDGWAGHPGAPDLPALARPLPAARGYRISARLVSSDVQDETVSRVAPAPVLRRTLVDDNRYETAWVREPDPGIYQKDAFWPEQLLQVDEAWQGTNRLARLLIRPVQWNPVAGILRVYRRMAVDVLYQPE